jgi:peptide/nickel transport system ATP-binding protein
MSAQPLLDISGLSVAIHDTPVLDRIDLSIGRGEIVGLVGESGSGKSMTALSIMKLLPTGARQTGDITLSGEDLATMAEAQMCRIRGSQVGMVFQEPMTALNPLQPIGRQVAETIRVHEGVGRAEALRRADEILNRVGLPAARFRRDRYPHELSGGQRQRVVIAIAIALQPSLLIADEPTTALDVTTQAQILDLLRSLVRESGMGLLLISHDLAVVSTMADRIAMMNAGRIVEEGPTAGLMRDMQHPYTRKLFAASSHVPRRLPERRRPLGDDVLLSVDGLTRDYPVGRSWLWGQAPQFRAVDGVSFDIGRGENVGLVGESGCGKSTLARALLGLEPVQGGRVTLAGRSFVEAGLKADPALRRHIQIVFQDPYGSFNPRHRVERLVSEPLHLVKDAPKGRARRAAVERVLETVGLSPRDADKYPHEFSGGQRQRLAIARALIIEPSLVILDEAVSALDVSIRAQILDLLADLSDRLGISYLFISHDLSVVRSITDRVLVMQAGRIVESGPTERVFASPQHAYTRQLVAATPALLRPPAAPAVPALQP